MPNPFRHYSSFATGEVSGSITAKQLPTIDAAMVVIKADAANTGDVYVGGAGVTIPDGTTDTTSGWPLAAGEETPMLPVGNLDELYIICDAATDDVSYIVLQ